MKSGLPSFFRYLSLLLGVTALAMLVPLVLALVFREERMIAAFAFPSGFVLCAALIAFLLIKKSETGIDARNGLLLVCLTWFLSCLLGALPFYLSGAVNHLADAFFETASGLTTTGASIFTDVESLPRSLLFWRAMTHWLGGMGIVVLTVALAPLIGTGAYRLFCAETPGPDKGKITPKITATARILWLIYVALTFLETVLLILGGMNWFDAVTNAFSTMGTGGFSVKNSGIAAYHSPWAEWVIAIFMILAGFNFNLFYRLLQGKGREILKNSEVRAYAGIIIVSAALCAAVLFPGLRNEGRSLAGALEGSIRTGLFQCVSILTTTGFSVADHRQWPPLAQAVLFFLMFIGGCSSSTSGGIKVIRHVILFKQARSELKKILYPRGVFSIQIDGKEREKSVVYSVAGFIFLYLVLVMGATIVVSIEGVDFFSSFNIGLLLAGNIGLGIVQGTMETILYNLPGYSKLALSFVMIAGRLELWTIFALLYWGGINLIPHQSARRFK